MISDFYANKTILLTGGTGFLGNYDSTLFDFRQGCAWKNAPFSTADKDDIPGHTTECKCPRHISFSD